MMTFFSMFSAALAFTYFRDLFLAFLPLRPPRPLLRNSSSPWKHPFPGDPLQEVGFHDQRIIADHEPENGAGQLSHVAGPGVVGEDFPHFLTDREPVAQLQFLPVFLGQVVHEQRKILFPFPEGRHFDLDDVQAVVEVLPEFPHFHVLFQVMIGGGDDPGADLDHVRAAQPRKLAALENFEQLGLEHERHVADLVEVNDPVGSDLELAGFEFVGSCEGALLVSEEFAFKESERKGCAVDLHEPFVAAGGGGVKKASHNFLARSGFAEEQNAEAGVRDQRDQFADFLY